MADLPGCTITGYQTVCVDADILITGSATPGDVVVTCLPGSTSINPYGTQTCAPTGIPCGFSAQATLCVAVPVTFGATATTTGVRQECDAPSETNCAPTAG